MHNTPHTYDPVPTQTYVMPVLVQTELTLLGALMSEGR